MKKFKKRKTTPKQAFMVRQGNAIKSCRILLGKSQKDLALFLGISEKTLSYIETGKSFISTWQIQQIILFGLARGYNLRSNLGILEDN